MFSGAAQLYWGSAGLVFGFGTPRSSPHDAPCVMLREAAPRPRRHPATAVVSGSRRPGVPLVSPRASRRVSSSPAAPAGGGPPDTPAGGAGGNRAREDRKSTRLNSSH